MRTVNVHQAKTELSKLLEAAEAGEEIVIARAGTPVARLVPVTRTKRRLGLMEGRFKLPRNFDAPLPDEVLDLFGGR